MITTKCRMRLHIDRFLTNVFSKVTERCRDKIWYDTSNKVYNQVNIQIIPQIKDQLEY